MSFFLDAMPQEKGRVQVRTNSGLKLELPCIDCWAMETGNLELGEELLLDPQEFSKIPGDFVQDCLPPLVTALLKTSNLDFVHGHDGGCSSPRDTQAFVEACPNLFIFFS